MHNEEEDSAVHNLTYFGLRWGVAHCRTRLLFDLLPYSRHSLFRELLAVLLSLLHSKPHLWGEKGLACKIGQESLNRLYLAPLATLN